MRNIEALKNYFLGKDPQLKETMADNSLRLIGIPGREFALRSELLQRLKALRKDMTDADKHLQDQIDGLIRDMETVNTELADRYTKIETDVRIKAVDDKIFFKQLTQDINVPENDPLAEGTLETGWYYTNGHTITFNDFENPPIRGNAIFYFVDYGGGDQAFWFVPVDIDDAETQLYVSMYFNLDEQVWKYTGYNIITDMSALNAINHVSVPTTEAVAEYAQAKLTAGTGIDITNNVISATGGGGIPTLESDLDVSNNLFILDEGIYYSGSHAVKYYDSLLGDYVSIVPQNALFFYSAAYSTFETINLSELGIPDLIIYKHKWDNGTSKWVPDIYTYTAFEGTDGNTAGTKGLVPKPETTDAGKFLKADGTWATPSGGGGTSDYTDLTNKPQINSVTLTGNKSLSDLGIGGTITAITGASVRVWDLNDGVYALPANCKVYYDGSTDTTHYVVLSTTTSFLTITSSSTAKYYYLVSGYNNYSFIYAGSTTSSTGNYKGYQLDKAFEDSANKVTSINSSSTDAQYPSAKLLYDQLALKQNTITMSTTDLTPGVSPLADGEIYFVYE